MMSSYALQPIPLFAHHGNKANLRARALKTASPSLGQPAFTIAQQIQINFSVTAPPFMVIVTTGPRVTQQINFSVTAAPFMAIVTTEPQVTAS